MKLTERSMEHSIPYFSTRDVSHLEHGDEPGHSISTESASLGPGPVMV